MNRRIVAISLFTVLLCLPWIGSALSAAEIKWYPAEEGLILGKKEGKKVFMNFFSDTCGYCKQMDRTTFKDPRVIEGLNEGYIAIRVDTEKNRDLARAYFVRGLPTTWFISETGEKISNLPGYVEPDMMLKILSYIGEDKYRSMSFQSYLESRP